MSAVLPFPDLNLMPDSLASISSSSAIGITAGELPVPKLTVKAEPIEECQIQNPSESISLHGAFSDSNVTPPPPSSSSDQSANSNLYAEYNRVSNLFYSAFGNQGFNEFLPTNSVSGAITAVPDNQNHLPLAVHAPPECWGNRVSTNAVSSRPTPQKLRRPQELGRIVNLGHEQQKHHRELVKRTRMTYEALRIHIIAEEMRRSPRRKPRADTKAATLMKQRQLWLNQTRHIVGSIPGIEIGDIFFYRAEMCVLGLHGQPQAGIDFLTSQRSSNGEPIATSVIVSGGYEDDEDTGEVVVYTGHGGQDKFHRQCQDQRLEGGNLAMERSRHYGIEVRVIRGLKYENSVSAKVYVYDGLYKIVEHWLDPGKSGFRVFKFRLVRIEGQPTMGSVMMKLAERLRKTPLEVRPNGYIRWDKACEKENVAVYLYNDVDGDQEPLYFDYLARSIITSAQGVSGCECKGSCSSDDCFCVRKNGGEVAYDDNGVLLRGRSVVFECGGSCKCGPSCKNRVAQKGLRHRLEVFRSREGGGCWSVRTLDVIQAGAFICEYAGIILTREQGAMMSMNGDDMIYPGGFIAKWRSWGDLSDVGVVKPEYPSLPPLDFVMDVSTMRNVAYYIRYSRDPNVMVQFVLYDHNDLRYPRVMLFAMENIAPLTELSLDYVLADEPKAKGKLLAICN
ncbi:unnamed protein product [Microthlaspi erraticum]|uniref:YDG domain-containing protein n=1 Tax=Microthlaspi erraticum TaxID=1685480 RepID=A0A6D2IEP6_9BRAS|nr:unnamed protein product [Microthlaspi erraticum]